MTIIKYSVCALELKLANDKCMQMPEQFYFVLYKIEQLNTRYDKQKFCMIFCTIGFICKNIESTVSKNYYNF